jgi:hypothetical protein
MANRFDRKYRDLEKVLSKWRFISYTCDTSRQAKYNNTTDQRSTYRLTTGSRPVVILLILLTKESDCPACDRSNIPEHRHPESLRPGADDAHAESTQKHQDTGIDPSLPAENAPTLVTEEVFRHQLHQRGENQKSS